MNLAFSVRATSENCKESTAEANQAQYRRWVNRVVMTARPLLAVYRVAITGHSQRVWAFPEWGRADMHARFETRETGQGGLSGDCSLEMSLFFQAGDASGLPFSTT
ncbi:hypothetical protein SAMN05443248_6022 [Bradyrhizobium erythrophlei]|jgi:hypothetical protein|uniref:Uncharacterized protein n=1 Tax=Bradyrhizobium erythrophlei TaxID=1437360 RepID=A0A1M5VKH1_9BRAD|nr:hypothetical protein SAMN05443248_6022 [Bradyrhizobium erythrophlei]